MAEKMHVIRTIRDGSIAQELEIEPGDMLLAMNGSPVDDIFDYQYHMENEYLEILIRKADSGEEWLLEIEKEEDEDLGIVFENDLMDEYRSCRNQCVFCFIDQMPPGMRDTLYFKDDDSRLSFLQGNYVTLTNMSDHDIDRIIRYHLAPINISFHTTNPELRVKMLHNRFAGEALEKAMTLAEAGVELNGQIVLCRGLNDGPELDRTLRDLGAYMPALRSVSVVPVGLTDYRDGLYPLEPFQKEDAVQVLAQIHRWQDYYLSHCGTRLVHASDEWYLLADMPLPEDASYEGYLQLENGVGMLRLLSEEIDEELNRRIMASEAAETAETEEAAETAETEEAEETAQTAQTEQTAQEEQPLNERHISVATGALAGAFIRSQTEKICAVYPHVSVQVYPIRNDFFGSKITVSGLITGQDLIRQMKQRDTGECLLIPCNMLRYGESVFLDDLTIDDVSRGIGVPIREVDTSGAAFVAAVLGEEITEPDRRQMYEQTDCSDYRTAECGEIDPV